MRRVGLVLALAFMVPATAGAASFSPTLDYAYQLAAHHWNAQPTHCSSVDREIVPDGSLGTFKGEAWQPEADYYGPCYVYIIRDLALPRNFGLACAVMFHEYGHLLGYGHSSDPRSIMFPEVTFVPRECTHANITVINHPARFL